MPLVWGPDMKEHIEANEHTAFSQPPDLGPGETTWSHCSHRPEGGLVEAVVRDWLVSGVGKHAVPLTIRTISTS